MNKSELIAKVSEKSGLTKKDSDAALTAFTNVIADALVDGDKVQIIGFGSFEVTERAERNGRNPQTGESILIKASKTPKFKPSKTLKEAVNGGE